MTTLVSPSTSEPMAGQVFIRHFLKTGADQTEAFQAAVDSLPSNGGTILLERRNYAVVGSETIDLKGKPVVWQGDGTVNGQIFRRLPGYHAGFDFANNRFFTYDFASKNAVTFDFTRGQIVENTADLAQLITTKGKATVIAKGSDQSDGTLLTESARGRDSNNNAQDYTRVIHQISSPTEGAENGAMTLAVVKAGVMTSVVQVSGSAGFRLNLDGTMRTVSLGAVDTGGKGFRALVVEN